jgi:cytochrome P450
MFTPFSLGKRACLGQNLAIFQLRIIAAHFVRYFDFELIEEPTFEYFATLKPRSIVMKVEAAQ